jgi:hypothetical protein
MRCANIRLLRCLCVAGIAVSAFAVATGPARAAAGQVRAAAQHSSSAAVSALSRPKIMIVGDSITSGDLGDYTWRYRLWQDLRSANPQFVGHWTGTENFYDDPVYLAEVNGTPPPASDYANPEDGYYNSNVDPSFISSGGDTHDALWGWTYHVAKGYIANDVSAYRPNYLLVALGYDDLAFNGSVSGTLADAKTFITNARAADPGIRILIGNVVHRTPLPAFPNLDSTITTYDNDLAAAVHGWSTRQSPVRLVDISSVYDPSVDAYDGLHPNGVGEYVIGDAFATAMAKDFGVGTVPGPPPSSVPGIALTAPGSLVGSMSGKGPLLQWGHVYGAGGYDLYERDVTGNPSPLPPFTEMPLLIPVPGDHWYAGWGAPGHTYQYEVTAVHGSSQSGPSSPVTLTMPDPEPFADPPADVTVTPSAGTVSIALSWTAPTGNTADSSITGYYVFWEDASTASAGEVPAEAFVAGTSFTITGLNPGDTYDLAIASVNPAGTGTIGGAPPAIAGDGAPAAPVLSAGAGGTLTWPAVTGATGYWVYQGSSGGSGQPVTWTRLPYEVPQGWNGTLPSGTYSVTAANGSLESAMSNAVSVSSASGTAASLRVGGSARSVNSTSWVPAWLRAAPGTASFATLQGRA